MRTLNISPAELEQIPAEWPDRVIAYLDAEERRAQTPAKRNPMRSGLDVGEETMTRMGPNRQYRKRRVI